MLLDDGSYVIEKKLPNAPSALAHSTMTSVTPTPLTHSAIRKHPLVCALVATARLLQGRLRRARPLVGKTLCMKDERKFEVFRHVTLDLGEDTGQAAAPAILVVRFEFARLSQRANQLTSLIPIPLIAGFPGFRHKLWMVDSQTGCWQGVYEWANARAAQAYEQSFVFGVMNRRATPGSLFTELLPATSLGDFLEERLGDE